jgi:acetylornithine deacetylase
VNGAELLAFLVSTPSISGSERTLANQLAEMLRGDGFDVQREGDSLWFSIGAAETPHLLMLSHIDTVPVCAGWDSDPHKPVVQDGALIGLGANDAKGSVAAMIMAARELNDVPGRVTFAFVAEEELGGAGVRAVKPKLGRIDAAIIGEPTALEVCTAQRGMLILRCTARGRSAHAAHAQLGENAIFKAARDIARFSSMSFAPHPQLGTARPQVTQITGGLARNQVPDQCEFFVDLRTTPNLDHREIVEQVQSTLESEVAVHSERYEPVATDENEPIVQAALAAAGRTETVSSVTTSDWAFLKGIPAVKIGPGDTRRSHQANEYLRLDELEAGARFYSAVVQQYFSRVAKEVAHA